MDDIVHEIWDWVIITDKWNTVTHIPGIKAAGARN